MFELSKQFTFDAAHTLQRNIDVESSQRIHGHSYRAVVMLRGVPDAETGMIMDVGQLTRALDQIRQELDHQFLDNVEGLGAATLENLSAWIWQRLAPTLPGLFKITVSRDSSGDACAYYGSDAQA